MDFTHTFHIHNFKVNLSYNFNIDVIVEADRNKLAQMLRNILNNALKFTKEGIILVKLENAEGIKRGDEKVCISIRDNGPGIKPEILHSLFTTPLSSGGGTGLGLIIRKSIVEAHGGKIWAENLLPDGRGSIFHFELPIVVPLKRRIGLITTKEVNKQQNRTIKNRPVA